MGKIWKGSTRPLLGSKANSKPTQKLDNEKILTLGISIQDKLSVLVIQEIHNTRTT